MKRNTIKWRIFKYNIVLIIVLIALTTVVFNIAIRLYFESDLPDQLNTIASRAEDATLRRGGDFFKKPPHPPRNLPESISPDESKPSSYTNNNLTEFYFMIDHSLKDPLSLLNANYILLDSNMEAIKPPNDYFRLPEDILNRVKNEINESTGSETQQYINFSLSGTEYIAIIKPISQKNTFGLGWIVIYSGLEKVNDLQWTINIILLVILLISALIIAAFSSLAAKKISAPFSSLNSHIGEIAERNFGSKIRIPVDDELQELVNNINTMSEKLESYDKAQKTFLQNASHEFRTPLMSIQSYTEGIKYNVVDPATACDVIIDETKRMTRLVEDLLYLSRLDTIEENYHFDKLDFSDLINSCIERMAVLAAKTNISIVSDTSLQKIELNADSEKLYRAFTNIISNCIRYAKSTVRVETRLVDKNIEVLVSDDGPGIDEKELPYVFERFYKGKKGNFGLGLAISKNVIEKHRGQISAENSGSGAVFKVVLPI